MKNTVLINIYGGPAAGKSTVAAGLFYELKKKGYDCGLVTEMATELVYDKQNDDDFRKFINSRIHKLKSLDFFVNRSNAFSEVGRIHNLEQSKEIDRAIKELAKKNDIDLIDVEQENAVEKILEIILNQS